jgi:hypothetical protein
MKEELNELFITHFSCNDSLVLIDKTALLYYPSWVRFFIFINIE